MAKEKWIVWQQHWVGYKPQKWGSYATEKEAVDVAQNLNSSPSGKWFTYSVEPPPFKVIPSGAYF